MSGEMGYWLTGSQWHPGHPDDSPNKSNEVANPLAGNHLGHPRYKGCLTMERLPLYAAKKLQRGVIEKYIDGEVEITHELVDVDECKLDKRGRRRFMACECDGGIETVIGIARLQWKSPEDRLTCIKDQEGKNKRRDPGESRWSDTLDLVSAIREDVSLPLPAVVHPALHEHDGLRVIDGARRIVAHVEADKKEFRVVVVRPKSEF